MKSIYTTQSLPEAELLRELLLEEGIASMLENEHAPLPTAAPLTIAVAESDEPAALELIRKSQEKRPPK